MIYLPLSAYNLANIFADIVIVIFKKSHDHYVSFQKLKQNKQYVKH